MDPRRRCGAGRRPVRPAPPIPKASRNPPRRRFHPRPRFRLTPRRAPHQKLPQPKISKNKAWPSGADGYAPQLPHGCIHFIATADQPEISFPDARETPHSSFFIRISSFLRPSLPPDPLTPRRRSPFWPSPVRRARKQFPNNRDDGRAADRARRFPPRVSRREDFLSGVQ